MSALLVVSLLELGFAATSDGSPMSSGLEALWSRAWPLQRRAENIRHSVIALVARVLEHLGIVFDERYGQGERPTERTRILDSRRVLEDAIVGPAEPLDDLHVFAAATIIAGRLLGSKGLVAEVGHFDHERVT